MPRQNLTFSLANRIFLEKLVVFHTPARMSSGQDHERFMLNRSRFLSLCFVA